MTRAEPIYFGETARPLFGMFHSAASAGSQAVPQRRCGVVVCTSLGVDFTRADRTLRHLAERLSEAGFSVLRFDPRGIGDSAGDEDDPDLARAWRDDIGRAATELRARGATSIALVGLRLGATLAMTAAAEQAVPGGVDSLVLWSPCITGQGYVSEVVRLHKLYERLEPQLAGGPRVEKGQEALGLFIPDDLAADLGKLDLLAVSARPAPHMLLIDGGNLPGKDKLLAHCASLGAEITCQPHPGQKFLFTVSHRSDVPEGVLTAITEWLSAKHPPPSSAPALVTVGNTRAQTSPEAVLSTTVTEQPFYFGGERALFGILSAPSKANANAKRGRPAILLLNAGTVNRAGAHRHSVRMARRWAELGFFTFRVDLSGIGDSPAAPDTTENRCYPPSALADCAAAMELLAEKELGVSDRFIVAGLCSGGDLAFQLGLADPRVAGAVIMNPRTFCVLDLQAVESASGEPPSATVESVPESLRRMASSGVETLLLVSDKDPGVTYVDTHFAAEMGALAGLPHFSRINLSSCDHTFTPVWSQAKVSDLVTEHLLAKHG